MREFGLLFLGAAALFGADELSQPQIDGIIQKFAAKETEFAKAREAYTYRQTARVQQTSPATEAGGRWETVSDIVFDSSGRRTEKVVRAPVSTLRGILLDP